MISNRSDTFHSAVVICVRVSVKQLQHLIDDPLLSRVTTEEGRSEEGIRFDSNSRQILED